MCAICDTLQHRHCNTDTATQTLQHRHMTHRTHHTGLNHTCHAHTHARTHTDTHTHCSSSNTCHTQTSRTGAAGASSIVLVYLSHLSLKHAAPNTLHVLSPCVRDRQTRGIDSVLSVYLSIPLVCLEGSTDSRQESR